MATATAKRLTRNPIIGVTLELSVEEALAVSAVLAQVSGGRNSAAKYTGNSVLDAVKSAGIEYYPALSCSAEGLYEASPYLGFASLVARTSSLRLRRRSSEDRQVQYCLGVPV
jgi:hypothetical protein